MKLFLQLSKQLPLILHELQSGSSLTRLNNRGKKKLKKTKKMKIEKVGEKRKG